MRRISSSTFTFMLAIVLLVILSAAGCTHRTNSHPIALRSDPPPVTISGFTPTIKLEQRIEGFLTELNDKYKMRAIEVVVQPGGFLGDHYHVGPGIRYIAAGQLTYFADNYTTIYRAGDYYYEAGNRTHLASNKADEPLKLIVVELLPFDWQGSSIIPIGQEHSS